MSRAFYCETNSETATFAEQQAQRIAQLDAALKAACRGGCPLCLTFIRNGKHAPECLVGKALNP